MQDLSNGQTEENQFDYDYRQLLNLLLVTYYLLLFLQVKFHYCYKICVKPMII